MAKLLPERSILKLLQKLSSKSKAAPSETCTVDAYVSNIRTHKNVSFIELSDGSTHSTLQAIAKSNIELSQITIGSFLRSYGTIQPSKGAGQPWELVMSSQPELMAKSNSAAYLLTNPIHSDSHIRRFPHLRSRQPKIAAIMRVRDSCLRKMHEAFEDRDYISVQTPIITRNDAEDAGEVFNVVNPPPKTDASKLAKASIGGPLPFFGNPTNLTVSAQLHLEALNFGLNRVYTLSPAFRAELSDTPRHLSEFWMLEAETNVPSIETGLDYLMQEVEDILKSLVKGVCEGPRRGDLEYINKLTNNAMSSQIDGHTSQFLDSKWPRLSYKDSLELLALHPKVHQLPILKWGESLSILHEKWIAGHFNSPVFITRYPREQKPFYMLPSDSKNSPGTVECFDLLVPELGELVGGSLREHRYHQLNRNLPPGEALNWYREIRQFGNPPHGGWGLGWERLVTWICAGSVGTSQDLSKKLDIRESIPFPRWTENCLS